MKAGCQQLQTEHAQRVVRVYAGRAVLCAWSQNGSVWAAALRRVGITPGSLALGAAAGLKNAVNCR